MKTKENDGKDVELNPVKEERVIEPIRKKISGLDKFKFKGSSVAYLTIIVVILFAAVVLRYTNPVTIIQNNTIEVPVPFEVFVNQTCDICETCATCETCDYSNCTQKYSEGFVLALMREAKKCEKDENFIEIDECRWKLNRTSKKLSNCTAEKIIYKEDCDDYCIDIEWDQCSDMFDGNLTTCHDILNDCEGCIKDCDDECSSDSNLGNCRDCINSCKNDCQD